MNRSSSRRALMVVAMVLLVVLAMADLMSRDSLLRRIFTGDGRSRQEQMFQEMQRRGIPTPVRGSMRMERRLSPDRLPTGTTSPGVAL